MRILNKKALHNYHILESLEVGIQLLGHEVKSIRAGRVELGMSFARIQNGEAYLINANIPPYQNASIKDYDPGRSRRLLLHKDQIQGLIGKLSSGKMALVPVAIYEKNNMFKVQLGLAKSKRDVDKRRVIKEKDHERRVQQELKGRE